MTTTISPERMEAYRRTVHRRESEQRQAMLLKEQFDAVRVVAFGSLVHGAWFNARSDIDLMAVGIPPEKFWRAWAALDQVSNGFEIDLVADEELTESLRTTIEHEGVEL